MSRHLISLLALTACSSGVIGSPSGLPVTGAWGGDHIALSLSDSGGTIEYDCARGAITRPLVVAPNGSFSVDGFHFRGHGGPVRQDEPVDSLPVRYSGTIKGSAMSLTVVFPTGAPSVYALTKGAPPRVFRCL